MNTVEYTRCYLHNMVSTELKITRDVNRPKIKSVMQRYRTSHYDAVKHLIEDVLGWKIIEEFVQYANEIEEDCEAVCRVAMDMPEHRGLKDVDYLRNRLATSQNWKCAICKKSLKNTQIEIDHIVPIAKGGSNRQSNLQAVCKNCNNRKGMNYYKNK